MQNEKPSETKATIYDIATRAGVSTTTVHKALHNRKGVSKKKREEILKIADELNYIRNVAAISLSRKEIHIGIVAEVYNEEFGSYIIRGIKSALDELKDYKLIGHFGRLENALNRPRVLQDFRNMLNADMDAVILFPTGPYKEYEEFNAVIEGRNIPVITINNEIPHMPCLCSIQQDGNLLGRMAADLMNLCNPGAVSSIFIGSKDVSTQLNSAKAFENGIASTNGSLCNIYESQVENQISYVLTENLIHNYPEATGIFVGVSQSIGVINKLKEHQLTDKFKIITVDTYPQIFDFMKKGVITATLNRRPYDMGRLAVYLLYRYFMLGAVPPAQILVPPSILTASAVSAYDKESALILSPFTPIFNEGQIFF